MEKVKGREIILIPKGEPFGLFPEKPLCLKESRLFYIKDVIQILNETTNRHLDMFFRHKNFLNKYIYHLK